MFSDGRLALLRRVQGHLGCLPRHSPWPATCIKVLIVFGSLGPEVCQLVPWKPANWCHESLTGALEFTECSTDQAGISRAPVRLSGQQLVGFQGTSWQTSGPRGPNTISTFMLEAGQWEGLGRPLRCPWTRLSEANLPSKNSFYGGGPLIKSVILLFRIFQTLSIPNRKAREMKFWENVHPPPCVTCHVSCVRYHMSRVTRHMSHVTCQVSSVIFLFFYIVVELVCWGSVINRA